MAKQETEDTWYSRKKILTLFVLFFPTLIVALIPSEMGVFWLPVILKFLIVFYQLVVIKNFVDTHYGE